jgi:predicted dinucleotide-binding enzyme
MHVAVLGSDNIGGTLGQKWASARHHVMYGVCDVQAPKAQAILASSTTNMTSHNASSHLPSRLHMILLRVGKPCTRG